MTHDTFPHAPILRYVTPTWVVWIDGKQAGTAVRSHRTGKWQWRHALQQTSR